MHSSELSNALNPHVIQTRPRLSGSSYSSDLQPIAQPPQQHVPHRSELELAMTELPPPPPRRLQPPAGGVHAVKELLRVVAATRDAQETERRRRVAWEREQEAKFAQQEKDLDKQMIAMRQEIASLRSLVNIQQLPTFLPQLGGSHDQLASPLSPVSSACLMPPYIQDASSQTMNRPTYFGDVSMDSPSLAKDVLVSGHPINLSPHYLSAINGTSNQVLPSPRTRKRQMPQSSEDGDDEGSGTETFQPQERPIKRMNHRDTRCLTIQHAMRAHILRVMQLETDTDLPDSHFEGAPIGPDESVRFVWDKTPKQSVHNGRMKVRILEDLKANRKLYIHVPDKEFAQKTLESTFDQSFTTLRQKFKAQRDTSIALNIKRREDTKAAKSRRLNRKKNKLNNRSDARNAMEAFEHVIFDGALQLECFSSEESDGVDSEPGYPRGSGILITRGLPWRSKRLQMFYKVLDEEDKFEKASKPKRGGKKERLQGPPKDGFCLPPKGVASWMISKRWMHVAVPAHPDLPDLLQKLVKNPLGFDWNDFQGLGEESGNESWEEENIHQHPYPHGTSSLSRALGPVS